MEASEWPAEPAERVRLLVERVLDELDLDGEVEMDETDDVITATVEGDEDYGLLIGRRGQTIDALQRLRGGTRSDERTRAPDRSRAPEEPARGRDLQFR